MSKAHHYLFNLPLVKRSKSKRVIVFGLNPGEDKNQWPRVNDHVEMETCCRDFHGENRKNLKWTKTCKDFCGDSVDIIQTEAFFWSSPRWNDSCFVSRFGFSIDSDTGTKHLKYCAEANSKLLAFYSPNLVLAPSLEFLNLLPALYGLRETSVIEMCPDKKTHRLMQEFQDHDGLPWLVTKHWSGARYFTSKQKEALRGRISQLLN